MKTGAEESEEHAAMSSNKVVFRATRFIAMTSKPKSIQFP
jgi:hypothetical protein